jgi:hypothetical protein
MTRTLEQVRAMAQRDANREGAPMAVLNFNPFAALYVVRSYAPGMESRREFVERVEPAAAVAAPAVAAAPVADLESLNVAIADAAKEAVGAAAYEGAAYLAAYDAEMARRAADVRAAINAARGAAGRSFSRHFVDGVECALHAAVTAPRSAPPAPERMAQPCQLAQARAVAAVLTTDQLAALRAFAADHGRTWKSQLGAMWCNGQDESAWNGASLREVRNTFGPTWLTRFRLPALPTFLEIETMAAEAHKAERAESGDAYATAEELVSILSDPMAYWEMVQFGIQARTGATVDRWSRKVRACTGDELAHARRMVAGNAAYVARREARLAAERAAADRATAAAEAAALESELQALATALAAEAAVDPAPAPAPRMANPCQLQQACAAPAGPANPTEESERAARARLRARCDVPSAPAPAAMGARSRERVASFKRFHREDWRPMTAEGAAECATFESLDSLAQGYADTRRRLLAKARHARANLADGLRPCDSHAMALAAAQADMAKARDYRRAVTLALRWQAAGEAHNEAYAAFDPVREGYRTGSVSDSVFLAARATYDAALAAYDAAEAAYCSLPNPNPADAPAPAPAADDQLRLFSPAEAPPRMAQPCQQQQACAAHAPADPESVREWSKWAAEAPLSRKAPAPAPADPVEFRAYVMAADGETVLDIFAADNARTAWRLGYFAARRERRDGRDLVGLVMRRATRSAPAGAPEADIGYAAVDACGVFACGPDLASTRVDA